MTDADQLNRKDFQDEFCKLFTKAPSNTISKRQVMEAKVLAFHLVFVKSIWIEFFKVLEDGRSVVCVTNAVQHTPTFGNLETLSEIMHVLIIYLFISLSLRVVIKLHYHNTIIVPKVSVLGGCSIGVNLEIWERAEQNQGLDCCASNVQPVHHSSTPRSPRTQLLC